MAFGRGESKLRKPKEVMMADEKHAKATVKLKMSVDEFGETCNVILDAFERGEPTVPTSLALRLVGHIQAVYQDTAKEIQALHDKYAHEGNIPQVMTTEIATKWIASLSIPSMWDIFQTATPNVFYASFQKTLFPDDKAQLKMLGFDAVVSDERFHARYMLKWNPPRNDEL